MSELTLYLAEYEGSTPTLWTTQADAEESLNDLARADCLGSQGFDWIDEDGERVQVWTDADTDRVLDVTSGRVTPLVVQGAPQVVAGTPVVVAARDLMHRSAGVPQEAAERCASVLTAARMLLSLEIARDIEERATARLRRELEQARAELRTRTEERDAARHACEAEQEAHQAYRLTHARDTLRAVGELRRQLAGARAGALTEAAAVADEASTAYVRKSGRTNAARAVAVLEIAERLRGLAAEAGEPR